MIIGVGVEGPSDREFWDKVLHKHFRGFQFDVRSMNNRGKLIRETPRLLDTFRNLHYRAGFILVDLDDAPCATSVIDLFTETVRCIAKADRDSRFLHVCIAFRSLEAWYLADSAAIRAVLQGCSYNAPADTAQYTKGTLRKLVRNQCGENAPFNEIAFAKAIAPKFDPCLARNRSISFNYFWGLMESKTRR
jgi:hypothetical protein